MVSFLFVLSDAYFFFVVVVKFAALLAGCPSHPSCLALIPVVSLDFLPAVLLFLQVLLPTYFVITSLFVSTPVLFSIFFMFTLVLCAFPCLI